MEFHVQLFSYLSSCHFFIIHDVWAKSNHSLLKIDKNIEKKSF